MADTIENERRTFRIQNQKMMLTYKTHLNKDEYMGYMLATFDAYAPKFFEIAHENGDETNPYPHSHVLIDWGKAFQSKNTRVFDYKDIHPHIQPLKSMTHWRNSVQYIAKEDISLAHLKTDGIPIADRIWSCETLEEALLKNAKKPNDVPGIMALFKLKPHEEKPKMPYTPHLWQKQLYEKIDKPTSWSSREITWVYETVGNTGKSYFGEYWSRTDPKRFYYINAVSSARDFATVIKTAVNSGWGGHCLLIDLTRSHEDRDSLYIPLEMIKSGIITATKYEGGTIDLGFRPHVVVFANWPPNISKLSLDRWDINKIEYVDNDLDVLGLRVLNIREAHAPSATTLGGNYSSDFE